MKLRDYQAQVIAECHKALREDRKRLLIQAPTGSGKSALIATLAQAFLKQNKRIAIVAHRSKLLNQLEGTLEAVTGHKPSYIMAGKKTDFSNSVQLCMAQTLSSQKRVMPTVDVILIDEAHISTSFIGTIKLINHNLAPIWALSPKIIIGLTATPYKLKIREGLCWLFDYIINTPSTRELVDLGYLTKPTVYTYDSDSFDSSMVKMDATTGDFNEQDLAKKLTSRYVVDVVDKWRSLDDTHKTILFAASVKQAKLFVEYLTELGYKADYLLGSTPQKERKEIYERFANKQLQILVNISVLTEGFDSTDIQSVVLARPSKSFALVSQMVGRGLRLHQGKETVNIIDCSGFMIDYHHMQECKTKDGEVYINDFFAQMADTLCPKCKALGEPPTKTCVNDKCHAEIPISTLVCPECGEKQPIKVKEVKLDLFPNLIKIEGASIKKMHIEYRFTQKELQKAFLEMRSPAQIDDLVFAKFTKFAEEAYYKGAIFGAEPTDLFKSAYSYYLAVVFNLQHKLITKYYRLEFGDVPVVRPLSPTKYMGLPSDRSLITREALDARYFELVKDIKGHYALVLNMCYSEIIRRAF
jgi:superfamily II DNA or RNA helicase